MSYDEPSNTDDVIDSRSIIERIEAFKAEFTDATTTDEKPDGDNGDDFAMSEDDWAFGLGEEGAAELVALLELAEQGELFSEWPDGMTLIRDSYFRDYAEQLAEDIGAIDPNAGWPLFYIDWERAADALRMDYSSIEFDGVTYWAR